MPVFYNVQNGKATEMSDSQKKGLEDLMKSLGLGQHIDSKDKTSDEMRYEYINGTNYEIHDVNISSGDTVSINGINITAEQKQPVVENQISEKSLINEVAETLIQDLSSEIEGNAYDYLYCAAFDEVYNNGEFDCHGPEVTDFVQDIVQASSVLTSPMLDSNLKRELEESIDEALYTFQEPLFEIREEAMTDYSQEMQTFARLYDRANPDIAEELNNSHAETFYDREACTR